MKLSKIDDKGKLSLDLKFYDSFSVVKNSENVGYNVYKKYAFIRKEKSGYWRDLNSIDQIPDEKFILDAFDYKSKEEALKSKLEKAEAECDKANADIISRLAKAKAKEEAEIRQKQKQRQDKIEREATLEKERESWINDFGSCRLKMMLKCGYELRRTYEIERGKKEFPDAIYNRMDEQFEYKNRANPSEEALLKEQEINKNYTSKIVWGYYRRDYQDEDGQWYGEPSYKEMIKINPPWSRYSFFLSVN